MGYCIRPSEKSAAFGTNLEVVSAMYITALTVSTFGVNIEIPLILHGFVVSSRLAQLSPYERIDCLLMNYVMSLK